MKIRLLLAGLAGALLLLNAGCAAKSRGALVRASVPLFQKLPEMYQILDYKTKAREGVFPLWLERYLEEGIWGVEDLPEYQDKYVFISANSGTNSGLLGQWAENFSTTQDFARLAAVRIEARFSRAALSYPDEEYGNFFALMVRAVSDGFYTGAVQEDDFWILRQYFNAGEGAVNREVYDFFVLVTIEKSLFEVQVNAILNSVVPQPPPSREQSAAIHRVRDHLFEGF